MDTSTTEEEEILTFDVSDEALEIAGTVSDKTNFTYGVCTLDQSGCFPHDDELTNDFVRCEKPAGNAS